MPSNRNLDHLFPIFREKVKRVLADMSAYAQKNMVGYEWIVIEGLRDADYQAELYAKGRTKPGNIVTHADGKRHKSNHQSGLAVDIAPKHGFDVIWNVADKHWKYLGHVARKHGLEWGGDWQKIRDMPHIQWPASDKATYKAAQKWLRESNLD